MKNLKLFMVLAICTIASTITNAQTKMVGGAEMYSSKNIVENAVNSKDHTTLVAAVKAADLVAILSSEGPFTVFAPVNSAFDALPDGTVSSLLKKENQNKLQEILTYHVLAGKFSKEEILASIKKGKGMATFKTVYGDKITATMEGDNIKMMDTSGNVANVTITDVNQSNGVIHVVDTVLIPAE